MIQPYDLVVFGAGPAGISTAISAARQGAKVALIEKAGTLGGIITQCLIHTLGGFYNSSGEYINEGLAIEFAERLFRKDPNVEKRKIGKVFTISAPPAACRKIFEEWIKEEENIHTFFGVEAISLQLKNQRVCHLEFSSGGRRMLFNPLAIVDATGNASIIEKADKSLFLCGKGRALGGMIFRLKGIKPKSLHFPRNIGVSLKIKKAIRMGILTEEFHDSWIDRGIHNDEAFLKISVVLAKNMSDQAYIQQESNTAEMAAKYLIPFLRRVTGSSELTLDQVGALGFRDGGRFLGEYVLTADDVRGLRKFRDPATRCCWPIEHWDSQGGIKLEYLPPDDFYEIPIRAMKVKGIYNLWGVGKCLSADPFAQASARVVGTCWSMGEAAGKAALG